MQFPATTLEAFSPIRVEVSSPFFDVHANAVWKGDLEHKHLTRLQCPIDEQFHRSHLDIRNQHFLPETSDFLTDPADGNFTVADDRGQHALNIVIALGHLLSYGNDINELLIGQPAETFNKVGAQDGAKV
jgi:hypothetical protein